MQIGKERVFGLDLIRAIAIGLVVFSHCTYILFPESENTVVNSFRVFGAIGVDLFFVLSGFLIGGLLLKKIAQGKTKFSDLIFFWKRRWLRTLPNYFLILLLNIALIAVVGDEIPNSISHYFIFIQNLFDSHPNFFTEAWSLSIEEYAYLILPLLLTIGFWLFKKESNFKLFLWISILSILGLTLLKLNYYFNADIGSYKGWSSSFRKVVIYRIDSIYIGFIIIYLMKRHVKFMNLHKVKLLIAGLSLFFGVHVFIYGYKLLPQTHLGFYVFVYLQTVIISLGLLFPMVSLFVYKGTFLKLIRFVSTRSYAIYLINYSLVLLTLEKLFDFQSMRFFNKVVLVLVFLIVTLLFSEMLYRYFEKPILKYRNRKFPS